MITENSYPELRIPKALVSIVCHARNGEQTTGEVFLDLIANPTSQHILNYFNSDSLYFPLRTSDSKRPVLVAKNSLIRVDIVGFLSQLMKEPSAPFLIRTSAVLEIETIGTLQGEFLIDSPVEQSRVLDTLNRSRQFIPLSIDGVYSLVNTRYLYKVREA